MPVQWVVPGDPGKRLLCRCRRSAFGQCRVRKDDVAEWEEFPEIGTLTRSSSRSIKSLKIAKPNSDRDATDDSANVAALLELVGEPLESLEVYCPTERSDVLLDAVWIACPNLKSMRIGATSVPSLPYFIDAFETEKCRIHSLDLTECTVGDQASRLSLFKALEGPTPQAKIASVLRELSFSDNPKGNYHFLTFDQLIQIGGSLNSNRALRYVGLGILGTLNLVEERNLVYSVGMLNGQVLLGQGRSLSIRHTCALLSIVRHATDAAQIPAAQQIAQLDSSVLLHILAFVAEPIRRSIALKHC